MAACLVVVQSVTLERRVVAVGGSVSIGRESGVVSAANDLVVRGSSSRGAPCLAVSRSRHCVLGFDGAREAVVLEARKPVFVDGVPALAGARLPAGESVLHLVAPGSAGVAGTDLEFRLCVAAASSSSSPGRPAPKKNKEMEERKRKVVSSSPEREPPPFLEVEVLTWNVGFNKVRKVPTAEGVYMATDSGMRLTRLAAEVVAAYHACAARGSAFVAALQEVETGHALAHRETRPHRVLERVLAAEAPGLRLVDGGRLDRGGKHCCLLVAEDLLEVESCLGGEAGLAAYLDLYPNSHPDLTDGEVRAFLRGFALARVRCRASGARLTLASAHVAPGPAQKTSREAWREWIRAAAAEGPVLLGADFNEDLADWHRAHRRDTPGFRLAWPPAGMDLRGWAYGTYHGYHRRQEGTFVWKAEKRRIIDGLVTDAAFPHDFRAAELLGVPDAAVNSDLDDPTHHALLEHLLTSAPADHFPT